MKNVCVAQKVIDVTLEYLFLSLLRIPFTFRSTVIFIILNTRRDSEFDFPAGDLKNADLEKMVDVYRRASEVIEKEDEDFPQKLRDQAARTINRWKFSALARAWGQWCECFSKPVGTSHPSYQSKRRNCVQYTFRRISNFAQQFTTAFLQSKAGARRLKLPEQFCNREYHKNASNQPCSKHTHKKG